MNPITLTKVAVYNGDLAEAARSYRQECEEISWGLGNTRKFGLFEENPAYLLMVSQQKDKKVNEMGYNFILTITSDSGELNEERFREFMGRTRISFKPAVKSLEDMMQNLGMTFLVFKQHGKKAMEVLKNM